MNGIVDVDASLAAAWVVEEEHTPAARSLLNTWEAEGARRLVPALFATESATVLLRYSRRGVIAESDVPEFLAELLAAVTVQADDAAIVGDALAIARRLGLGKVYDSLYAALAQSLGCDLWTGDERFYNAARGSLPWIRWVGERPS